MNLESEILRLIIWEQFDHIFPVSEQGKPKAQRKAVSNLVFQAQARAFIFAIIRSGRACHRLTEQYCIVYRRILFPAYDVADKFCVDFLFVDFLVPCLDRKSVV